MLLDKILKLFSNRIDSPLVCKFMQAIGYWFVIWHANGDFQEEILAGLLSSIFIIQTLLCFEAFDVQKLIRLLV